MAKSLTSNEIKIVIYFSACLKLEYETKLFTVEKRGIHDKQFPFKFNGVIKFHL